MLTASFPSHVNFVILVACEPHFDQLARLDLSSRSAPKDNCGRIQGAAVQSRSLAEVHNGMQSVSVIAVSDCGIRGALLCQMLHYVNWRELHMCLSCRSPFRISGGPRWFPSYVFWRKTCIVYFLFELGLHFSCVNLVRSLNLLFVLQHRLELCTS